MADVKKDAEILEPTAEELNEILKVRREKLSNLQKDGKDPFTITKYDVTHTAAGVLNNYDTLEGKTVRIAGRIMSRRIITTT